MADDDGKPPSRLLLTDDGAVACAIDDEELFGLKMLMDDVFNKENFISNLVFESNPAGRSIDTFFATCHDYVVVYGKDAQNVAIQNRKTKFGTNSGV